MTTTRSQETNQDVDGRVSEFFSRFKIGTLLSRCGIRKMRGIRPLVVLRTIFDLAFQGRNIFTGVHCDSSIQLGKDAVYRFLSFPCYNWRRLLGLLAQAVINGFLQPLTSVVREKVLILDITTYDRNRSRKVELLSRFYDHSRKVYVNGFRMLTLGWSDGASFIPIDHAPLSSTKEKYRVQGITKDMDRRTCGFLRRQEAITKSTELIVPMVKRALGLFIRAKYLLMDAGFAFPVLIRALIGVIHVICMLKNTPKIFYEHEGQSLTLAMIYRRLKKRPGKARVKASVVVGIGEGKLAKIVFVRNRRSGCGWLAILCTDVTLSDDEVIRLYGKRWDIEVFFKMVKHYLKLDSEVQVRDFDAVLAHSTIVMMRYVFLAFEQRLASDDRTIGPLFLEASQEIRDLSLAEALVRMFSLIWDRVRESYATSEDIILEIMDTLMKEAIALIRPGFFSKCES